MANRNDAKIAYKALYLKHRDLSMQVENCRQSQPPDLVSPDALDQRVEKMKARIK